MTYNFVLNTKFRAYGMEMMYRDVLGKLEPNDGLKQRLFNIVQKIPIYGIREVLAEEK